MSTLTLASVTAALDRPLEQRGGAWRCQVCDRPFKTKQAVGPHQLHHRREVGLAPPRASKVDGLPLRLTCGSGCGQWVQRRTYRAHLRRVHGLTPSAADLAMRAHAKEATVRQDLAVVTAPPEVEEEPSVMTDLTAVEAVSGILNAARTDGLVPVVMLPRVVAWIGHTQQVLDELARLTDGAAR